MNHQKNLTLELFKILASYMVIFIHVWFYGKIGVAAIALARFAVPFFFVISGFYSYKSTTDKIKKRIFHIARLLIFAVIAYFLYDMLLLLVKQDFQGMMDYLTQYLSVKNLVKLLVLNIPIHREHLWYLFAILYVYIIFFFVTAIKIPEKLIFFISALFLLLHLFLGEGLSVFHVSVPIPIVRNFALMGIPFFGMGLLIRKCKDQIIRTPNYIVFICVIMGVIETVFSRYFFGNNELYIGSLFILVAPVVLSIKYAENKYLNVFSLLDGCSTHIYIFHMMIATTIGEMYLLFHINYDSVFIQMVHPLLVCLVSTVVAFGIKKLVPKL